MKNFFSYDPKLLIYGFFIVFFASYGQTFFISLFNTEIRFYYGLTDGEFGFTGISPAFENFGTWECWKSNGFFDLENLTGARLFIKDSTGKWVPFTNAEVNIPQHARALYEEVSFEQFDVDWSTWITSPAGAPVCTYAANRKQWQVDLTTGIITGESVACGGGGGES